MSAGGGKLNDMNNLTLTDEKLIYKSMSIVTAGNNYSSATFVGEKTRNSEKRNILAYGCLSN